MRFGPLLVAEAEGTILAHSLLVGGKRVAKGTVLTPEHIAALVADGVDEVTVALLSTEDVEENQAATAVAEALAPDPHALNIRIAAAGAGRVNLYAMCAGVLSLDVDRINALNGVDPMITIAT
ncbi:MAG: molybdopterin biosynthesis protein, partial [Pseudomonadota bacterium]